METPDPAPALRTARTQAPTIKSGDSRPIAVNGPPTMPIMTFHDDNDFDVARLWTCACVQRGLYVHPTHNWFIGASHTPDLIKRCLGIADEAFAVLRSARP